MTIRATNPTNLTGPTGPSFLDQSKATPSDINPELFKSRNPERQPSEGTVSSDYLKRTREEDPWPPESSCAPKTNAPAKTTTVTLSDCRIDTPTEDLATDQPFQMSCQATTTDGSPLKGDIRFKLYCTLPDGTEEFTNIVRIGTRTKGRYTAQGRLVAPRAHIAEDAMMGFRIEASYTHAQMCAAQSPVISIPHGRQPSPIRTIEIESTYFEYDTAIIVPSFAALVRDLTCRHPSRPQSPSDNVIALEMDHKVATELGLTRYWVIAAVLSHRIILIDEILSRQSGQRFFPPDMLTGLNVIHDLLPHVPTVHPSDVLSLYFKRINKQPLTINILYPASITETAPPVQRRHDYQLPPLSPPRQLQTPRTEESQTLAYIYEYPPGTVIANRRKV